VSGSFAAGGGIHLDVVAGVEAGLFSGFLFCRFYSILLARFSDVPCVPVLRAVLFLHRLTFRYRLQCYSRELSDVT